MCRCESKSVKCNMRSGNMNLHKFKFFFSSLSSQFMHFPYNNESNQIGNDQQRPYNHFICDSLRELWNFRFYYSVNSNLLEIVAFILHLFNFPHLRKKKTNRKTCFSHSFRFFVELGLIWIENFQIDNYYQYQVNLLRLTNFRFFFFRKRI